MEEKIVVSGAREHNLKNVSVEIPRDKLVVFSGLSGSGKSSLAFDTIFAEGQRRYVESLSSYARQFLGQMQKPEVDFISGLSPAVAIDQKSTSRNPRSTVGTITEIYDYLRLLFARAGTAHCPRCGEQISSQTPQQIVDQLLAYPEGLRFQVLAPVVRGRKGEHVELFESLLAQGYNRFKIDGQVQRIDEIPALAKTKKHDIDVVVDRLVVSAEAEDRSRVTESIEGALRLADGQVLIEFVDFTKKPELMEQAGISAPLRSFSERRSCPQGHSLALTEIEPRTFSFNAPYGACEACGGLGVYMETDPELVVPKPWLSLAEGAIDPWNVRAEHHLQLMRALGDELDFSVDTPFSQLPEKVRTALLEGRNHEVKVRYVNRWGRTVSYSTGFEGVLRYVERKYEQTESSAVQAHLRQYMREMPCRSCKGARLKPEVLAVLVGGLNIDELTRLSISEAGEFISALSLTGASAKIAAPVLREVKARLKFLQDVGLGYLTLARSAASLSGGEAQRIRLATQIGSALVGVLYVLDEPSIGLHQRDNQRLINTLLKLRDLGNTLIVVEHDEDTIRAADWIVDIGPRAGEGGGEVVYNGPIAGILDCPASLTGAYLSGRERIALPATRREREETRELRVLGASENNLRDLDVTIPLGMFVVVTGVSGSGKSTLINQILYQALAKKLNGARCVPGKHRDILGLEQLDKVVHVDQSPIGRTPRSNPATYTGVWDQIRQLFAATPEAQLRGYGPGRFSFNVKGGRCEECSGDGTLKIEMNFLPDVYVPCETCQGARYNRDTLEVYYRGKNVRDVLEMPISEACEFFKAIPRIHRYLNTLVEVGLGYVRLGQSATTLSGGEAQRVKLAAELQKRSNGRTIYVLDEPTTGLHLEDIRKLLGVLQSLVDKGNSVIVIEHNLDVIKNADWIIDMGPEGGSGGGQVVAEGTPEQIALVPESHTGRFLAPYLQS